jgi:hypothetical protein
MKNAIESMKDAAAELDRWMRFAGCAHIGYIGAGAGVDKLIIYWLKHRMGPGGMPETFCGYPIELKRIDQPIAL